MSWSVSFTEVNYSFNTQLLQCQFLQLRKSAEEQVRWRNQWTSDLAQNIKQLGQQVETCLQLHVSLHLFLNI
jgi:hypothetical protein